MPLLFLFFGYFIIYIIGAPVINFATSAIEILSLNDAPTFDTLGTNLLESQSSNSVGELAQGSAENSEDTNIANSKRVASSAITYPNYGDQFGKIVSSKVGINEPLYYGDSDEILRVGAGQYIGSMLPGELGTTLIGGHNMPSFGKIYYLQTGDTIQIQTHYGEYTYRVTETKVSNYQDPIINEKLGDHSNRTLILYTCYPLDAIGLTPDRAFIFATLVSGPIIDETS